MQPSNRNRLSSITAFVIFGGLIAATLIGCSPKVASLFFDGVPAADSTALAAGDTVRHDTAGPVMIASNTPVAQRFSHPPYELRKCNTCHSPYSAGKLAQPEPGVCYQCHEDFSLSYKYVHGPAAAGYCTKCHQPHSSVNGKLLRETGQGLCLQCHENEDVFKGSYHSAIGTAACTDCHNPHGGNDNNLLR